MIAMKVVHIHLPVILKTEQINYNVLVGAYLETSKKNQSF
jgi:hypothetical protein